MRRVLREFRVEITAVVLIALGIFLLTEQVNLRVIILRFLRQMASTAVNLSTVGIRGLGNAVLSIHPSDLLGLILIVLALLLLTWRVRWRLMHSEEWTGDTCPVCGSSMHRSHRRRLDHLISFFVPVRRYRCRNRDCGWTGLRIKQAI